MYITIEGIDGSGKSSHVAELSSFLDNKGIKNHCIFEPGFTEIGKKIRSILMGNSDDLTEFSRLLLFLADRNITFEKISKMKLEDNYIIISDRGLDSSVAYQGNIDIDFIKKGNECALHNKLPDLTILLDINPIKARERLEISKKDYYDKLSINEKEKIRNSFLEIANNNQERVYVVDANNDFETIQKQIREKVLEVYSNA